jgi:DcuC family C4-dicarboxylate transporter
VVIVGVARYIIKGYSATGVLFVGGLVLLIASALMGHKVLPGDGAPVILQPILLNTLRFCS